MSDEYETTAGHRSVSGTIVEINIRREGGPLPLDAIETAQEMATELFELADASPKKKG